MDAGAFYLRLGGQSLWLAEDESGEPPEGLVEHAARQLEGRKSAAVRSIAGELDDEWEHSERVSGLLAVRLGHSPRNFCTWCRTEHRESIEWGGDPRRPARSDPEGGLSPRDSFEAWTQIVSELARTDELTGLANRRELMRRLEEEVTRARRYGNSLSFAILDLDHFKPVNDRYGHQVGDRVLRRIGELLDERTRSPDMAGRYGGEEFGLVLPESTGEEAVALSEPILESVRELVFEADGREFGLTASIGVAGLEDAEEPTERLIGAADEALYRAKEEGRDRVAAE